METWQTLEMKPIRVSFLIIKRVSPERKAKTPKKDWRWSRQRPVVCLRPRLEVAPTAGVQIVVHLLATIIKPCWQRKGPTPDSGGKSTHALWTYRPPPSTSTSTSLRRHSQIDACQGSWEGHPLVQSFLLPSKFRLNITSFNAFGKEIQTCLHIVLISNVTSR